MTLKAVLLDFSGVIINDAALQGALVNDVLIAENLRLKPNEYFECCLGQPDRACLKTLLERRGRVVEPAYLNKLVQQKAEAYGQQLSQLQHLPIYMGIPDFLFALRSEQIRVAIAASALRQAVEFVLQRSQLDNYVDVIVGADQIEIDKPDPMSYERAIEGLNRKFAELKLQPEDCLAIESSYVGIVAAKTARISVAAVANLRPFHMLQRRANWVVDSIRDLEIDRIRQILGQAHEG